jgi:NAD(P)-dependent dehydrogenase (short-subunit alcohol dehydrogenase family)
MPDSQGQKNWAGKVVAITGASAGVGRAAAQRFARSGAWIALLARDSAALEETKVEVEKEGGRGLALPVDVADAAAVFVAAEQAEAALGPIEIWINDAMLTVFSPFHEMSADEYRRVTEVTYLGFVHGTMAALRHMRPRKRGIIIQIGSSLAYRGIPLQSAYCGAKHAIRGFTEFSARRASSRWQPGQARRHRASCRKHAPVRLGANPYAARAQAGRSHYSARGCG